MPKYGSYEVKGNVVADTEKRSPAKRVSYDNTRRMPRTKEGNGHLGTIKPLPKP